MRCSVGWRPCISPGGYPLTNPIVVLMCVGSLSTRLSSHSCMCGLSLSTYVGSLGSQPVFYWNSNPRKKKKITGHPSSVRVRWQKWIFPSLVECWTLPMPCVSYSAWLSSGSSRSFRVFKSFTEPSQWLAYPFAIGGHHS